MEVLSATPNLAVVTSRYNEGFASPGAVDTVDEAGVPLHPLNPLASAGVPNTNLIIIAYN